ncbi:MAG: tRNA epoxyqueuosine(34) reductase QueG [Acidobacteriota bacterium]|nr:tRNA epoxyqueuosine(34) reductase QueG [Acidobacteriota bacterium]
MLHADGIKEQARSLGFDVCGIAPAAALPELAHLPDWLARGCAGEMIYLHKSAHVRADIRKFLPSARSVIVTGTVYNTDEGIRQKAEGKTGPSDPVQIARYARGRDYHVVLGERLEVLVAWMREQQSEPFDAAIFVDKHQVQERPYARHAGIGWIGKNTCVINPELGSFLFLAGIATDLALDIDAPSLDQCGACTLCIDACPTGALVDAHVLDATRCISYLTIETAGAIAPDERPQIANHAYGCDICQDVCPWNLAGPRSEDPAWHAVPRNGVSAAALWQQTDNELHQFVAGSAMTHLTLSGFRRNLAMVIGNSGDGSLAAVLDRPGRGIRNAAHSAHTPAVEDAVAWARGRLKTEG